ncbi:hypothetical protein AAVH_40972, partial [Aphelenchoides avenae]
LAVDNEQWYLDDGRVGGFYSTYAGGNLTLATVLNAGAEAARFHPQHIHHLLKSFLDGEPILAR